MLTLPALKVQQFTWSHHLRRVRQAHGPAMSLPYAEGTEEALTKNPATVPCYYRCRTHGCAGQVPALRAEKVVREALDHPPESWSAEDKAKLATYATEFDFMWPINQRRVLSGFKVERIIGTIGQFMYSRLLHELLSPPTRAEGGRASSAKGRR